MTTAGVEERDLPAPQLRASTEPGSPGELLPLLAGFAALGSGLTFFALAADALLSGGGMAVVVGGVTGVWAPALIAWGILSLRGMPARGPATALLSAAVPTALPGAAAVVLAALAWSALLAPAGSRNFDLTLASALALVLLQLGCHGALRRRAARRTTATPHSPGRLLTGLFLSAVLVAGITTPGLAASTAGDHAVPHGQHGPLPVPADHGDH